MEFIVKNTFPPQLDQVTGKDLAYGISIWVTKVHIFFKKLYLYKPIDPYSIAISILHNEADDLPVALPHHFNLSWRTGELLTK